MGEARDRQNQDLADLLFHWTRRFPGHEMTYPVLGMVLAACKKEWRDPRWLIERVPANAKDPMLYLHKLLNAIPFPFPADDHERSYWTWDKWENRHPKRAKTIWEILGVGGSGDRGVAGTERGN